MTVRGDKMDQTLGGFLGALSRFLSLNSILEQEEIHNRGVVYCDELKEEGVIHLQVKRGIIPLPRLIPFNIPLNSEISKSQDDEYVFEIFAGKENVRKKSIYIQHGFLDFSKIRIFNPKTQIQNFRIRYERFLDINYISSLVKVEKKGEKVIIENKSNKKIRGYKVIVRMQLPFYLRDISNYDGEKLENFKEKYMERNIEVYDDRGTSIGAFLEHLYQKNAIRIEGDISWFTDINPNERKTFKIFISDLRPYLPSR